MNKEGAVLAARILTELKEISKLVYRIEQGWNTAKKRKDDFYLDSVALNLLPKSYARSARMSPFFTIFLV
jgi:hypothetical protein